MKVGIFYGSTTGNAQTVAESINDAFSSEEVICKSVGEATPEELTGFDLLILGSSTWGDGDLQDDWDTFLPGMDGLDLTGRKVALFGVGDQSGWSGTFVDAMGIIFEKVKTCGATVVGSWPLDGYEHTDSRAEVDGAFVGLAIDESNQADKTQERVSNWVEALKQA